MRSTATTGNVNGAGFNTANANFPTDLAATSATGNAPVVSSATYTFVAGDVGAWLYVKSGTNWTPGFYRIASVNVGAATLTASIASATQLNTTTNMWIPNTVAGIATTASPTGGTFGVDYSQQDIAQATATDYSSIGSSTTMTSASAGFTRMMVGNIFHQTTTGVGAFGVIGWYEIVSYTNSTTVVLDRTPNSGTASVSCTGFIGGAGILNALEDAFYEMIPAASMIFMKSGTYTPTGAVSITSTNSTAILNSFTLGYTSVRGDTCTGANRPTIAFGANGCTWGQGQSFRSIIFTTTSANGIIAGTGTIYVNCKILNSSATAGRIGINITAITSLLMNCEIVSQNGTGVTTNTSKIYGCYIHDSNIGVNSINSQFFCFNILEACTTQAVISTATTSPTLYVNNTFYGREAKLGIGLNLSGANATSNSVFNNIFYGFTTAVSVATGTATSNLSEYNDYFNNTTDATNWYKDDGDIAVDPQFVNASQISGTTGTTSGSVLTQSGGAFGGVNNNVDYLHVISGTGVTTGIYLITSHTTTMLTVNNALGTSSAGNVVYFITNGHNFAIGANLKATGFPGTFQGNQTTGYLDIGAVERQETGTRAAAFS